MKKKLTMCSRAAEDCWDHPRLLCVDHRCGRVLVCENNPANAASAANDGTKSCAKGARPRGAGETRVYIYDPQLTRLLHSFRIDRHVQHPVAICALAGCSAGFLASETADAKKNESVSVGDGYEEVLIVDQQSACVHRFDFKGNHVEYFAGSMS